MLAIYKKELKSFFNSPVAYVMIGLFVLIFAFFYYTLNIINLSSDFSSTISFASFFLIIVIPILTMRIIAEDRKSGVEVILLTSPTSVGKIVTGKYLASLTVFLIMTAITFIFPIIMGFFGTLALAQILSSYLGFILLGAALISIGLFASSVTENQIVAAIISFVIGLIMWFIAQLGTAAGGALSTVLNWLSISTRYNSFTSGILNLSDIVYFVSFAGIFIFLTARMIEKRRWSQG